MKGSKYASLSQILAALQLLYIIWNKYISYRLDINPLLRSVVKWSTFAARFLKCV